MGDQVSRAGRAGRDQGVTTKAELEGKRNPIELKGWRAEAQPEARKSAVEPG